MNNRNPNHPSQPSRPVPVDAPATNDAPPSVKDDSSADKPKDAAEPMSVKPTDRSNDSQR